MVLWTKCLCPSPQNSYDCWNSNSQCMNNCGLWGVTKFTWSYEGRISVLKRERDIRDSSLCYVKIDLEDGHTVINVCCLGHSGYRSLSWLRQMLTMNQSLYLPHHQFRQCLITSFCEVRNVCPILFPDFTLLTKAVPDT